MDTIIAKATPSGESALAILRISGAMSSEIAKNACKCLAIQPRFAKLAYYHDLNENILDQVVITFFDKNKSYTGDFMLEISCHGNPLISELICKDLVERGCRLAMPGEFTKLAFINGKIDLSQAEAVAQIISAKSHKLLTAVQRNLKGDLSNKLIKIQDLILGLQASIEANIDFPEDDIEPSKPELQKNLANSIINEINYLLKKATHSKYLQKNIRICLIGKPNAGKSSLFNEMIGKKRALIHEQAGTTRDYLEMEINLGSQVVTVVDTAGIHQTMSEVEQAGVELSYEQAVEADFIVWVVDDSVPYPSDLPQNFCKLIESKPTILVRNKADLTSNNTNFYGNKIYQIQISCVTKSGIKEFLRELNIQINRLFDDESGEDLFIGQRHEQLIKKCHQEVELFLKSLDNKTGFEIISANLTQAREYIDEMIGKKTNENMLDKLFGQFCIGK